MKVSRSGSVAEPLEAVSHGPESTGQGGQGGLWGTGSRLGSPGVRRGGGAPDRTGRRPHAGPGCGKPPGGAPKARLEEVKPDSATPEPLTAPLPDERTAPGVTGRADAVGHRARTRQTLVLDIPSDAWAYITENYEPLSVANSYNSKTSWLRLIRAYAG